MNTSIANEFIAGAIGGGCGLVVGHPFDTMKVLLQTYQLTSERKICLRDTCRIIGQNGMIRGFFRGMSFPLATSVAVNSVFFGVYGNTLKLINNLWPSTKLHLEHDKNASKLDFISCATIYIAGCTAGLAVSFVQAPADLIKVLLQSQLSSVVQPAADNVAGNAAVVVKGSVEYFNGPKEATLWMYRQQGIVGFYRGFTALLALNIPASGIYVVLYECLYYKLSKWRYTSQHEMGVSLVCGGLAGVGSWLPAMPFDVVKNLMQADACTRRYHSIFDCCREVFLTRGISGFFTGGGVICLRAFPVNGVTFLIYSQTLGLLKAPRTEHSPANPTFF